MDISIDTGAEEIIKTLENAGFSAYITGSAVTEYLLGMPLSAIHISTSATPADITAIYKTSIKVNPRTKSVTVIKNRVGYEISEYRQAKTSFAMAADAYDELSQATFTIDALAYNPREGFLDFFGGVDDIKKKQIRLLNPTEEVFLKNPAEMLRAVRLCAALGFSLESLTQKAIRKFSALSKQIPYNIRLEELNKLLLSDAPSKGFYMLYELGMMASLMPELARCFLTPQKNKYHIYNVGEHIMHTLDNSPKELLLRWAALLHDVGKPKCSSLDSNGIIHFYGHHRESMAIAEMILSKLHLERAFLRNILLLIEYHDVRIDASMPAIKRLLSKIGDRMFYKLLILQEADARAKNPVYVDEKLEKIRSLRHMAEIITEENQPYRISDLAINARDLMKLKYKAGRQINDTLKILLEDVIVNPSLNDHMYLINKAKMLKNGRSGK